MNRDNRVNPNMQLAPYGHSSQLAPWEQPSSGGALGAPAGPAGAPPATPLQKVHRLLRGRYFLAFVLALIGAAAGATAGYLSQKPGFSSTGVLSISGVIPSPDHKDVLIQMYGQHMARQVAWLKSERLLRMAMSRPDFKAVRQFNGADPVQEFAQNLKVEHIRGTDQIGVTYTDLDPAVSPLAVKAIIRTYNEHFKGTDLDYVKDKIRYWEARKLDAERVVKARENEIEEHVNAAKFGVDNLTPLIQAKLTEQTAFEREALRYKHQLETLRGGKAPELSIEDIARIDEQMARKVAERDRIRAELAQKRLIYLEGHHTIDLLRRQQQAIEQEIDKYASDIRSKWVLANRIQPLPGGGSSEQAALISRDPAELELMVDIAEKNASNNRKETERLGYLQRQIDKAKASIVEQNDKLKEASRELEKLRFQQESIGDVTIISEGNSPTLAIDNRIKFGLLGFMAGGGLPVALLLLVGLMDRRYRYSDEPGVDVSGITLLGILPNLPDRLSDPEQAAIAAHCVHQIRTMLQINGSTLGAGGAADETAERRVFAVTSASPGDGKTSLTLALGLSYAACGTQTLLIDCDLVGGGLTSRMNVNASEGVLEAIADRALLSYVRTTDIADVSILPVGNARGHHASTLSPGALRRLIDEAKKHFEVILIDTGPILGSIEASLVCAAADGVVLTVARGQQRPMVEKALSHLAAIGARLAGVVFNRAQTSDFERSISGMSVRSISRHPAGGNGHGNGASNGHGRYGPVAKAVAGEQE